MPTCLGLNPESVAIRDEDQINYNDRIPNLESEHFISKFEFWHLFKIWKLVFGIL